MTASQIGTIVILVLALGVLGGGYVAYRRIRDKVREVSQIAFGTEDSGTNGYQVRYEAYEGAAPEISGGKLLEGTWEVDDAEKNIYKISVPEGMNFRQLYVNGEKGIRARTGVPTVELDPTSRISGAESFTSQGKNSV